MITRERAIKTIKVRLKTKWKYKNCLKHSGLRSDKSRDMWSVIRYTKGHKSIMSNYIDDNNYDNNIMLMFFSNKCKSLYKTVPYKYSEHDISKMKLIINPKVKNC